MVIYVLFHYAILNKIFSDVAFPVHEVIIFNHFSVEGATEKYARNPLLTSGLVTAIPNESL